MYIRAGLLQNINYTVKGSISRSPGFNIVACKKPDFTGYTLALLGAGYTCQANEFVSFKVKNVVVAESTNFIRITSGGGSLPGLQEPTVLIKDIQILYNARVYIQDSDMQWAGRRSSYYGGSKISSLDVNVNSSTTVDGGPVVVINTVNSNTPSTPMIPVDSAERLGRGLVNFAGSNPVVTPGRALVNRIGRGLVNMAGQPTVASTDGRALVNIAGQPTVVSTEGRALFNIAGPQPPVQSSERQGRGLVNYGGQPIVVTDARALVNRQ